MKNNSKSEKIKLALIPVLGCVLLAVLPGSESSTADIEPKAPGLSTSPTTSQTDRPQAAPDAVARQREISWPHHSLNQVLSHNPFVLHDPRAELDRRFEEAGISDLTSAKRISASEFATAAGRDDETLLAAETPAESDLQRRRPADRTAARGRQHQPDGQDARRSEATETSPAVRETAASDSLVHTADAQKAHRSIQTLVDEELLRRKKRLVELSRQPVTMLVESSSGNWARIAGKRVQAGDLLEDGIRVVAVTPSGIELEVVVPDAASFRRDHETRRPEDQSSDRISAGPPAYEESQSAN